MPATKGQFLAGREKEKTQIFVVDKSDLHLEVNADSISSEWTSESEAEHGEVNGAAVSNFSACGESGGNGASGTNAKKKRKRRLFRLRHKMNHIVKGRGRRKDRNRSSSSSSSSSSRSRSSSSSTSSGSKSAGGGEVALQKRQRMQMMEDWKSEQEKLRSNGYHQPPQQPPPPSIAPPTLLQAPAPPSEPVPLLSAVREPLNAGRSEASRRGYEVTPRATLEWFAGTSKAYRCFALAPRFLSEEDINTIHRAARHQTVKEINDRKMNLAFKHKVSRFEMQLRGRVPSLYYRLLALMEQADGEKWRRMRYLKKPRVYPEMEYIEYDVAEMKGPCYIEPHVDNKSVVTMVAMLSRQGEYQGGHSCFRRAAGREGHREVALQMGDVVLFRGEKLTHWITPVTGGRRVILQIELSRV
eukprot:TRINITY_DN5457_c1_g1_i1.p1 TRINITY_DN5457_c1_g1~~TRINITY_DN5457_c1_g1_i1.p1  ORF type:complete len:447 (-),score=106.61 TRINITY_DN5457_c1_g1_i1:147-1385(-)